MFTIPSLSHFEGSCKYMHRFRHQRILANIERRMMSGWFFNVDLGTKSPL